MKSTKKIGALTGLVAIALCCSANADVTRHLVCQACSTWNSQGIRSPYSNYQIGFSTELPNMQAAYFVFDLSSIKGKTVTGCTTTIIGSTDYSITDIWTSHPAGQTEHQFKVGIAPENVYNESQITTLNNNTTLFIDAEDAGRNQDLGYSWVLDGLHTGQVFDTFHYNTVRLQNEVNAGGLHAFWACDRFDSGNTGENYIWGSTRYTSAITLNITTTN